MGLPGIGIVSGFTNPIDWITQHLSPGKSQPAQPPPATPPAVNPSSDDQIKKAVASVPQPSYQYPFSPLQAQLFLSHILGPQLQQQKPMGDFASQLAGMGFKIDPKQTADEQKVQDTQKAALQSSFSSPILSFLNMLTQQGSQDKAINQALHETYLTNLRNAIQPGSSGALSPDLQSFLASIGGSGG